MMTKEEARALVEDHLDEMALLENTGIELAIMDEQTLERDFGWVFFYNSKVYLEDGHSRDMLAGNAPIIVDKTDGSLHDTGTAKPIEFYIQNYERFGTPQDQGSKDTHCST